MTDLIQIMTTAESGEAARALARRLVEERLAACVQVVGPITSVYRWKGEVEEAPEWLCLIKTRAGLYERVEAAVKALHSYEVPEILAWRVTAVSASYLAWVTEVTGP
ncbi:MAG TPA: divalent-cation tolerance protein CutA [Syntrophales bacterium]|nr:divalent-cation tolerance protein CutA [Syntrophales bacterium]